ncbi:cell division protein ZapA [Actinobacillus minor]|uniref:cell division protein ZapA n=1 Tax=Actinobacillus minor TaxID=51047 RepID=UPI0026E93A27|nr:cell division protein ZapA [Actinobacillus minor]
MSSNNIEIQIFGQILRLHCPPEQQENLLASAQRLEERVAVLKDQSGIIQLEKVLAIVALNLNYELELEKQKNENNKAVLENCIQQLDSSLTKLLSTGTISVE